MSFRRRATSTFRASPTLRRFSGCRALTRDARARLLRSTTHYVANAFHILIGKMYPIKYCIGADCRNNEKNSNCQFFSVPASEKDSERRRKWLTLLGREDLLQKNVKKGCYLVCCAHFDPSAIKIKKRLDETSVPALLLPDQSQHSQQGPSCSKSQPIVVQFKETQILLSKSMEGNMSCSAIPSNSEEIKNKGEVIVTKNKIFGISDKVWNNVDFRSAPESSMSAARVRSVC